MARHEELGKIIPFKKPKKKINFLEIAILANLLLVLGLYLVILLKL